MSGRTVWVFRIPNAGLTGRDVEYAATVPLHGVVHFSTAESANEFIERAGHTPKADWLPRTEPEDVAVHAMAAKLYAAVYAASMANPPELTRDSARNVTSQNPASVAEHNAKRAVLDWRETFYPETLPPIQNYGGRR